MGGVEVEGWRVGGWGWRGAGGWRGGERTCFGVVKILLKRDDRHSWYPI